MNFARRRITQGIILVGAVFGILILISIAMQWTEDTERKYESKAESLVVFDDETLNSGEQYKLGTTPEGAPRISREDKLFGFTQVVVMLSRRLPSGEVAGTNCTPFQKTGEQEWIMPLWATATSLEEMEPGLYQVVFQKKGRTRGMEAYFILE